MKRILAMFLVAPSMLFAQSRFEGTWRVDPQSTQYIGHEKFLLQDGVYRCSSCVPLIEVKADGKDHTISGSPYFDAVSVRVLDEQTVEIVNKKAAKPAGTSKLTVSKDGNTLITEFTFVTDSGQSGSGKYRSTRIGTAPDRANKISGEWQPGKLESASESNLTVTYRAREDGLSMSDQVGGSYVANFDGKDYPYKGDPGITSVSLRKLDANTIEETAKRNGKVVTVSRLSVAPDGQTLSASIEDRLGGRAFKWTARKQ